MQDHFSKHYEWDEDGKLRKKKRVMPDGATMHIPMGFYDGRFFPTFADGSPDHTDSHRPGYRFLDTNDADRVAANDAYEKRSQQLHYTNRQRQQDAAPPRTRTLDELQQAAEVAWQERNKRLQSAWRNKGV